MSARTVCLLLTLGVVGFSGCARVAGQLLSPPGVPIVVPSFSPPSLNQWRHGPLVAGVGRADITPPPGFPTGGDGPAGNLARGYWTRLYARAFFFADSERRTAVLVSVDTFAIPGGLTAMVAHDIVTKWAERGVRITPDAIMIAATHTHQGPGNYLTAGAYNQFGSKFGGFSRPLFDFLVRQITLAIDQAINDALAFGSEAEVLVRRTRAGDLQLNRAPSTFLLNPMAQELMNALHPPPTDCDPVVHRGEAAGSGWNLPGCPRLRAADPNLTTVEIRRDNRRIGVMLFYAMHPTVLDPAAPLNSGDFAGVATLSLEREWATQDSGRPVVGFFNGAEGDVVARRNVRDVREVVAIAQRFADHVKRALAHPAKALDRPIIVARRDMLRAGAGCAPPDPPQVTLAAEPVIGTAAFGGGEDDRSQLYALGWRDGVRYLARNGQGPKLPALDSELLPMIRLTSVLGPPRVFPSELPLQVVRIGEFSLAAFPGELSTAAGAMVRTKLAAFSPLVVVGLANEYVNYVATPDEYGAQDYMAASTIWGPYEAAVFACRIAQLAHATNYSPPTKIGRKRYFPGPEPHRSTGLDAFGPAAVGEERAAPEEELERILLGRDGGPARNLHFVEWREEVRDEDDEFTAAARRAIRIQVQQDGVWRPRSIARAATLSQSHTPVDAIDDDRGIGVVAMLRRSPPAKGTGRNSRHWRAFWIGPLFEDLPPGPYRFEVETRDAHGVPTRCHSDPFWLTTTGGRPLPHQCAAAAMPK